MSVPNLSVTRACDYELSAADANELKGIVCLPDEFRQKALEQVARIYGRYGLVRMFSAFIGMANSVVQNNREIIELFLIIEGKYWPTTAEKINLPTIFGALCGVETAIQPPLPAMCETCAFRLGSPPNQSPSTSLDAKDAAGEIGGQRFMCHQDLADDGEPVRVCAGYANANKKTGNERGKRDA